MMKNSSPIIQAAVAAAVLTLVQSSASAQNKVWTGASNTVYTNAANWSVANGTATTAPNATNEDGIFPLAGANPALTLTGGSSIRRAYLYGGDYSLTTGGQTFNLAGGTVNMGSGGFTFNGNVTATGALQFAGTGTGATSFNGAIVSPGTPNTFTKYSEGALNLNGSATGAATLNTTTLNFHGGVTTLSGNAAFNQSGAITIGTAGAGAQFLENAAHDSSNAALVLDYSSDNTAKLAATALSFSNRGLLDLKGNAAGTTQALGALALGNSAGVRIQANAAPGSNAQLTFASLTNAGGLAQYLSSDMLGGASKVVFTSTTNTDTNGVLRYSIVKDASTGSGANFAQYGVNGVQALASYTTHDINAATNTAEVDILAATPTPSLTAARTFNALRISGGNSLTLGNFNLTPAGAGGLILNTANDYEINGGGTGVLNNTSTTSYIYLNSNKLTVNAGLTTNQNLFKSGVGRLDVAGTYTNNGSTVFVDKRTDATDVRNPAEANDSMRISGLLAGSAALNKSGLGQLALTGSTDNSPFAPGVTLTYGTLVLAKDTASLQDKALGTGPITLTGGGLAVRGNAASLANTSSLVFNTHPTIFGGEAELNFTGTFRGNGTNQQSYAFENHNTSKVTFSGRFNHYGAARTGTQQGGTSAITIGGPGETVITAPLVNGGINDDGTRYYSTYHVNPTAYAANTNNGGYNITKVGAGSLVLAPVANNALVQNKNEDGSDSSAGLVPIFDGTNSQSGKIIVRGGYLRLENTGALSANANLNLGEVAETYGQNAVLELGSATAVYGTFARTLGTAENTAAASTIGTGQIQLTGNSSGFASYNGTSTVTLNGNAGLTWASTASFLNDGSIFTLGSEARGSAGTLDFTNPIALGVAGKVRTIRALNGAAAVDGILSGSLTGAGKLVKDGAGGLSLTSNGNTYSGNTEVAVGILFANNTTSTSSATGTGTVTVKPGAALAGGGYISGATTVSGSVRPGNSIGTLNVANNVTWNSGNAWIFELGQAAADIAAANLASGSSDLLNLTNGSFLKGTGAAGSFTFDFAGTGMGGVYKLLDWTGSTSFTEADFAALNLAGGQMGTFTVDGPTSALYLTVVPEPTSLAVLGLAGLLGLRRRRLN